MAEPAVASAQADEQAMENAIEDLFSDAAPEGFRTTTQSGEAFDQAAVWELFAGVAANQAQPVKDFMFELHRGTATKDWLDICGPVMGTLIEAANAVEMTHAAESMGGFAGALQQAATEPGRRIEGAARELILERYAAMAEVLPDSFALGEQTVQRESIIIHSLLKQVPGVGHVTFERLYGSGLTTLAALFQASERDLVATTGIPERLCGLLCQRLREHHREVEAIQRAGGPSAFRKRLVERTAALKKSHGEYERVAESHSSDDAVVARKRGLLQERQLCAFQIEVLLAEMGEIELAEYLQKLPFERRIETLEEFLAGNSAQRGAGAA